jgi:hypothetical protein
MSRKVLLWLSAVAALAVLVAYQVVTSSAGERAEEFAARADIPAVQRGVDVLSGIVVVPVRIHRYDYRRPAFGDAWTDDNDAPGGHNGCDTRNDILNRDLVDKTYVSIKRCPDAVATGTLPDPYTSDTIRFMRGARTGEAVQIDHIVSAAPMENTAIWAAQDVDDMPLSCGRVLVESSSFCEGTADLDMS